MNQKSLMLLCAVFLISCIALQAAEKAAQKNYRTVLDKTGGKFNVVNQCGQNPTVSTSRHSTLRKKHASQLKLLKHIHEQQQIIMHNTLKNPASLKQADFNNPRFRADLRLYIQQLPENLKKMKKFAFLDKMHIIDQVVLDIQSGRIKYEKCKEKDPIKILKYIQRKQDAALRSLQKKESSRRAS